MNQTNKNKEIQLPLNDTPIPLDVIELSPALDGSFGTNRNTGNGKLINANNDLEAIQCWLSEFEDSPQTFRNYRKEIERLLLWSLWELNKPLSSLGREDIKAYQDFLKSPTPHSLWCGSRKPRTSNEWRPFRGPLGDSSIHQVLKVIGAAFGYLSDAGYLLGNPVKLVRRRKQHVNQNETVERFLEQESWEYLWAFIENSPEQSLRQREQKYRTRFIFSLLYLLGPRVSEVATLKMNDFKEIHGKWWCSILGKGNKRAKVPVNSDMVSALIDYRRCLDLSDLPESAENTPLVRSIKGNKGISNNMLYRIVKKIVREAADALEERDPSKAHKLRKASTHWFRHTAITHQADTGIPVHYLMKNARHNDIATTSRYLHAEDLKWHEQAEKHQIK